MTNHQGGRGRKASDKIKHVVVAISLPPNAKRLLDSWVTEACSRSEVVTQLIQAHAAQLAQVLPLAQSQTAHAQALVQPPQMPRKAPAKSPEGKHTSKDFEELFYQVGSNTSKSSWAAILHSLKNGARLIRSGGGWVLSESSGRVQPVGPRVIRDMISDGLLTGTC